MTPTARGPAPEPLHRHGDEIGRDYAQRRRTNSSYRFQWPHRDGQRLYEVAREALHAMTDGRCSYCDGHPLDDHGEDQIDHFCPKGRPEFYELVCVWTNLFLTCTACNKAKLDQWDELLLRPDDSGYQFERYFEYRFDTGTLHPNGAAQPVDQARAARTIEILKLNRQGACTSRRRMERLIRSATSPDDLADVGYRFLVPLCSPTPRSVEHP